MDEKLISSINGTSRIIHKITVIDSRKIQQRDIQQKLAEALKKEFVQENTLKKKNNGRKSKVFSKQEKSAGTTKVEKFQADYVKNILKKKLLEKAEISKNRPEQEKILVLESKMENSSKSEKNKESKINIVKTIKEVSRKLDFEESIEDKSSESRKNSKSTNKSIKLKPSPLLTNRGKSIKFNTTEKSKRIDKKKLGSTAIDDNEIDEFKGFTMNEVKELDLVNLKLQDILDKNVKQFSKENENIPSFSNLTAYLFKKWSGELLYADGNKIVKEDKTVKVVVEVNNSSNKNNLKIPEELTQKSRNVENSYVKGNQNAIVKAKVLEDNTENHETKRTVFLKVLNRDPLSGKVQLSVIDPEFKNVMKNLGNNIQKVALVTEKISKNNDESVTTVSEGNHQLINDSNDKVSFFETDKIDSTFNEEISKKCHQTSANKIQIHSIEVISPSKHFSDQIDKQQRKEFTSQQEELMSIEVNVLNELQLDKINDSQDAVDFLMNCTEALSSSGKCDDEDMDYDDLELNGYEDCDSDDSSDKNTSNKSFKFEETENHKKCNQFDVINSKNYDGDDLEIKSSSDQINFQQKEYKVKDEEILKTVRKGEKQSVEAVKLLDVALQKEFIFSDCVKIITSQSEAKESKDKIPTDNQKFVESDINKSVVESDLPKAIIHENKEIIKLEFEKKIITSQSEAKGSKGKIPIDNQKFVESDINKSVVESNLPKAIVHENKEIIKIEFEENIEKDKSSNSKIPEINQAKRRSRKVLPVIIQNKLNAKKKINVKSDTKIDKIECKEDSNKFSVFQLKKNEEVKENSKSSLDISESQKSTISSSEKRTISETISTEKSFVEYSPSKKSPKKLRLSKELFSIEDNSSEKEAEIKSSNIRKKSFVVVDIDTNKTTNESKKIKSIHYDESEISTRSGRKLKLTENYIESQTNENREKLSKERKFSIKDNLLEESKKSKIILSSDKSKECKELAPNEGFSESESKQKKLNDTSVIEEVIAKEKSKIGTNVDKSDKSIKDKKIEIKFSINYEQTESENENIIPQPSNIQPKENKNTKRKRKRSSNSSKEIPSSKDDYRNNDERQKQQKSYQFTTITKLNMENFVQNQSDIDCRIKKENVDQLDLVVDKTKIKNKLYNSETKNGSKPKSKKKKIKISLEKISLPKDNSCSNNYIEEHKNATKSDEENEIVEDENINKSGYEVCNDNVFKSNKRGRKKKNQLSNFDSEKVKTNEAVDVSQIKETVDNSPKKRGRKRKSDILIKDRTLHPRLLLVTNRSDLDKEEHLETPIITLNKNQIKCGLCKEITTNNNWIKHVSGHYGVGWKEEQEELINVKSFREVFTASTRFFKECKIKSLNCRLCGMAMKSGLGLIGHVENCGLSAVEKEKQKIACEYCQKLCTPLSLPIHLKASCPGIRSSIKVDNTQTENSETDSNIACTTSGRSKRKSLIKAEKKLGVILNDGEEDDDEKYVMNYKPITGAILSYRLRLQIKNYGKAKCISTKCNYESSNLENLIRHNDVCDLLPRGGYVCIDCNFHNNEKNLVIEHYKTSHKVETDKLKKKSKKRKDSELYESGSLTESSDSDEGIAGSKLKKKSKAVERQKDTSKLKQGSLIYHDGHLEEQMKCWSRMEFFQKTNFSESPLYTFAVPLINSSKIQNIESYLPINLYSMKFKVNNNIKFNEKFGIIDDNICKKNSNNDQINIDNNWEQIKRYSARHFNNEKFIFMGGGITSLSWIPTPHNNEEFDKQYLAIAYKNDIYKFTKFINPILYQTCITIYEIESVRDFKLSNMIPKLYYNILIEIGPIHHIEFLPSGGYSNELNRLGLMAIANINSDINIYSLPLKESINRNKVIYYNDDNIANESDRIMYINLKPVMTLKLDLIKQIDNYNSKYYRESQCVKICWSKAKHHNIIVGAYTNGFISIWNINEDNNLNRFSLDNLTQFVPVSYFQVTKDFITGLDLHYDMNGVRWLYVVTQWKDTILYDIKDISYPLKLVHHHEKTQISASRWPIIWENPLYCGLNQMVESEGVLNSFSPLGIHYGSRRVFTTSAGLNDMDYNNWLNICVGGSNNGDFAFYVATILNLNLDNRGKESRLSSSFTNLIRIDGQPISKNIKESDSVLFDSNYLDKYGLIIGKVNKIDVKKGNYLNSDRNPPPWLRTYVKINKIASNNNYVGHKLYAAGYENGLVRINKFNI